MDHVTVCGLIPSPLSGVTIYSSMAESTLPSLQQVPQGVKATHIQAIVLQWRLLKMMNTRW